MLARIFQELGRKKIAKAMLKVVSNWDKYDTDKHKYTILRCVLYHVSYYVLSYHIILIYTYKEWDVMYGKIYDFSYQEKQVERSVRRHM